MMPLPQLWAACFFMMLIMLGLDTVVRPAVTDFTGCQRSTEHSRVFSFQFSGLETLTASVIDMFPAQMRRPWRREIFLLVFCSVCFTVQISLTTQVRNIHAVIVSGGSV